MASKTTIPHIVQVVIAVLSAVAAIGTQIVHTVGGLLPAGVAAVITSLLTGVAAVAGFLRKEEPEIDKLLSR